MKTIGCFAASALFAVLAITPAFAQSAAPGTDPHHPAPPADTSAQPATPSPGPGGESMAMMGMCRQMMGDMSGMPMMGGVMPADPKQRAEMLQMHGDMMRAMGDIMMKHARRMQGPTEK